MDKELRTILSTFTTSLSKYVDEKFGELIKGREEEFKQGVLDMVESSLEADLDWQE